MQCNFENNSTFVSKDRNWFHKITFVLFLVLAIWAFLIQKLVMDGSYFFYLGKVLCDSFG